MDQNNTLKSCLKKQLATKDIIKYELICDITRTEEVVNAWYVASLAGSKLNNIFAEHPLFCNPTRTHQSWWLATV